MCCGGKCLFFIPVRTGALIFGYIIAVISALGTIALTGLELYFFANSMSGRMYTYYINNATGCLLEFLSSFVCSVLLLVGITQKKPVLVKTFLIYGMVHVVLLATFLIMLLCVNGYYTDLLFLAMGFVGVYVMCLYMVYKAYQPMDNGHVFLNHPLNAVMQLLTARVTNDRPGEVLSPSAPSRELH